MYNRYQGNTGHVKRVEEQRRESKRTMPPPQKKYSRPEESAVYKKTIFESIGNLLPKKLEGLETEDLLLAMILYLLYRESGDKELLIIMGAMFLL